MVSFLLGNRVQLFAVLGALALLVLVLELVRRRDLQEKYALIWIAVACFFVFVSAYKKAIQFIADILGIYYAPSAFLLVLIVGVLLVLLQFSVVISRMKTKIKILAQEVALLKGEKTR